MNRQRIIQVVAVAVGLLMAGTYAKADGWSISIGGGDSGLRLGLSVGTPCLPPVIAPRPCPPPLVMRTPIPRHGHWLDGYPHRRTIMVGHPVPPPVVVVPPHKAVSHAPCPVSEVTVWVVNSNGSQTPVRLTRRSTGYIGLKGEYYHTLPSNEQLLIVYGF